jgi:hypothetical protein
MYPHRWTQTAAALAGLAMLSAASVASAGPPVINSGQLVLKQTYTVNFDTGASGGSQPDLWFEAVNWSQMDLRPKGKAKISSAMYNGAQGGRENWNLPICDHADYGTTPQPVTPAIVGAFFCVKTNRGHTTKFQVGSVTGNAAQHIPLVLHLGFITQ